LLASEVDRFGSGYDGYDMDIQWHPVISSDLRYPIFSSTEMIHNCKSSRPAQKDTLGRQIWRRDGRDGRDTVVWKDLKGPWFLELGHTSPDQCMSSQTVSCKGILRPFLLVGAFSSFFNRLYTHLQSWKHSQQMAGTAHQFWRPMATVEVEAALKYFEFVDLEHLDHWC
jgi:hypothetical protein